MKWIQRLTLPSFWTVLILATALVAGAIVIEVAGGAQAWRQWLNTHAEYFRVWRMFLYTALAYSTFRLHQRLRHTGMSAHSQRALLRTEVAAAATLILLEIQNWRGLGV